MTPRYRSYSRTSGSCHHQCTALTRKSSVSCTPGTSTPRPCTACRWLPCSRWRCSSNSCRPGTERTDSPARRCNTLGRSDMFQRTTARPRYLWRTCRPDRCSTGSFGCQRSRPRRSGSSRLEADWRTRWSRCMNPSCRPGHRRTTVLSRRTARQSISSATTESTRCMTQQRTGHRQSHCSMPWCSSWACRPDTNSMDLPGRSCNRVPR